MRPAGEIRAALLQAACELTTTDRAPTLQELAARACVGTMAALHTVRNMKRAGQLQIPRTRCVAHRNRPVAEYAPASTEPKEAAGYVDVASVFSIWAQG
jgi:hypothetical protein